MSPSAPSAAITTPAPIATSPTPTPAEVAAPTSTSPTPPAEVAAPASPASAPSPVRYTLDPARSSLYVQVFKEPDTAAAGLSHDHVVAATGWTGSVTWDPSGSCAVDIRVPVSGLRPDEDALRNRVGYDVMLTADQRADVKGNMLGGSQLDATRFGSITFSSSQCAPANGRFRVSGDLTIHGRAKAISSTFTVNADPTTFSASGTFTARATDFGFQPYTALLGALKNKDEMRFTVDLKGEATPTR